VIRTNTAFQNWVLSFLSLKRLSLISTAPLFSWPGVRTQGRPGNTGLVVSIMPCLLTSFGCTGTSSENLSSFLYARGRQSKLVMGNKWDNVLGRAAHPWDWGLSSGELVMEMPREDEHVWLVYNRLALLHTVNSRSLSPRSGFAIYVTTQHFQTRDQLGLWWFSVKAHQRIIECP
jgi:hypothetical protein